MKNSDVIFLLVEDDDIEIRALKRSFQKLKIANDIIVAHDGIEALEVLRGENGHKQLIQPFIILLDINMPRMNGLEFLKKIRKDPNLDQSVVFVLTTSNDEEDKLAAYKSHIAGYIVKDNAGESVVNALDMLDRYWRVVELPASKKS